MSQHLNEIGKLVQDGWTAAAQNTGLNISVGGVHPLSHMEFAYANGQVVRTLFTQLMLERGYLATNSFYATFAHQAEHVSDYLTAVDEAFSIIADSLKSDSLETMLKGPVAHAGFQRLT